MELSKIGKFASDHGHRITIHPSSFCVVASPNRDAMLNSIRELNQIGLLFDVMGLEKTPFNKINIHMGGIYGDKEATAERFCKNLVELGNESLRCRVTIENDDGKNGFSVGELHELVYKRIGIPIVMDILHHRLNTGNLTVEEALKLAVSTWPEGVTPVIHYSESKREKEDPSAPAIAHSTYIDESIPVYGQDVDIMVEAKGTEQAVLRYLEKERNK